MKRFNYIIGLLLLIMASCSKEFLERNPLDKPSNEVSWNTEKDALAAATGVYNDWFSATEVLYFDCASDNAHNPFPWEGWHVQASGLATPTDHGRHYMWYDKITRCNNFLENIQRPDMNEGLRTRLIAEVRFIRAWHYFLKVTLYGDVPLVTEVLPVDDANLPRTPKDEVVRFILNELDDISAQLPDQYGGSDIGRATRGAALTLKARMELFVGDYDASARTTAEIMTMGYSLFPSYNDLFKLANVNNQEVIMDVQYVQNQHGNTMLGVIPPASVGGWASINPTQALVDAYEAIDGKTIDESELYTSSEPYQNRDPRLAASIVYPGALYESAYFNPIDVADPTGDYYAPYGRSKTGYHPRKYVDNLSDYDNMWNTSMNIMVMRYAEVLLMYAESKIELGQIDESMYNALDMVRERAGMPQVDRAAYSNQAQLRELVRRERRVELALEGLRWFDICRWGIGEEVMNVDVYGAYLGKVDHQTGALSLTDEQIWVEKRIFDPAKNYLWPIPLSVIDATPAIQQNPHY